MHSSSTGECTQRCKTGHFRSVISQKIASDQTTGAVSRFFPFCVLSLPLHYCLICKRELFLLVQNKIACTEWGREREKKRKSRLLWVKWSKNATAILLARDRSMTDGQFFALAFPLLLFLLAGSSARCVSVCATVLYKVKSWTFALPRAALAVHCYYCYHCA